VLGDDGQLKGFSQQDNVLAILADCVPEGKLDQLWELLLDEDNPELCRCSPYFYCLFFAALEITGR